MLLVGAFGFRLVLVTQNDSIPCMVDSGKADRGDRHEQLDFKVTGNLGAKPELKHVDQNGESLAVLDLRLYFDRRVPSEREDRSRPRRLLDYGIAFGANGPSRLRALLDKGMRVYASGTLLTDTWLDSASTEPRTEMRLRLDYLALDLARVQAIEMEPKKARGCRMSAIRASRPSSSSRAPIVATGGRCPRVRVADDARDRRPRRRLGVYEHDVRGDLCGSRAASAAPLEAPPATASHKRTRQRDA